MDTLPKNNLISVLYKSLLRQIYVNFEFYLKQTNREVNGNDQADIVR